MKINELVTIMYFNRIVSVANILVNCTERIPIEECHLLLTINKVSITYILYMLNNISLSSNNIL